MSKDSMKAVTLIFPGQGSQYVGMGKSFLEGQPKSIMADYFSKADETLGFELSKICLEGPDDQLKLTHNTQPAIVTHSIALYEYLKPILDQHNAKIEHVLGHSVGEYSALVAAGALSFEDAVKAVHWRGQYMQEAVPVGVGKMIAVLRVSSELIQQACEEVSTNREVVTCANFNEPGQTVISGHANACDRAIEWLEANQTGRMRYVPLAVSAPFHCPLMRPAATKLSQAFEKITFHQTQIPYIANIDAQEYGKDTPGRKVAQNLIDQVCSSVLWTQSIQSVPQDSLFIEVGPGKVLKGLLRKINPDLKVFSLDEDPSFEKIKEFLG